MSHFELEGNLTVSEAERVKQLIFSAMQSADQELVISIAKDAVYDFSLLQTLVSAFKSCTMLNVELKLQEPLSSGLRQSLLSMGLIQPDELDLNTKRMGKTL